MISLKKVAVATFCLVAIALSIYRIGSHYYQERAEESWPEFERVGPTAEEFLPFKVVPPFPAITNATFIPASQVQLEVTDDELILGVVVNDIAKAYPINMLTGPAREIINDSAGDFHFAATW